MLHNFAVNICAKVSLTLLFTCVRQCVDLADRLTDVLATAISYVTLVLLRKYPKYSGLHNSPPFADFST